jgi:predicted nucleic acid-binding protein
VSLAEKPKVYWDACAWIGLIRQEADKIDALRYFIERAQKNEIRIWTSTFTLAEVYKRKCDGEQKGIAETQDRAFEDYLSQEYVILAQVDVDVGKLARLLLRKYPTIGKPQDAIHVATAVLYGVDELHTFDRDDLLKLDGQIARIDGGKLKICKPEIPPPLTADDLGLRQLEIFEQPSGTDDKKTEGEADDPPKQNDGRP